MSSLLRIHPEQRFACSQCGRCCHRFDVVVSPAEMDLYRKRNAGQWFLNAACALAVMNSDAASTTVDRAAFTG